MNTSERLIRSTLYDAYEEAMRWLVMALNPHAYSHNRLLEMLTDQATVEVMLEARQRCAFREVHEYARIAPNGRLQALFVHPRASLSLAAAAYARASKPGDLAARIVEREPLTDDIWIGIMDSGQEYIRHNIPPVSVGGVRLHVPCDLIYHGGVCFVQIIYPGHLPSPK